jgi:hypothetical protein
VETGLRQEIARVGDEALAAARSLVDSSYGQPTLTVGNLPVESPFPYAFQEAPDVARLLQFDARLRAHDGDIDGALDSVVALLNVSRSLGDTPAYGVQVQRANILNLALRTLEAVLAQGEPSAEKLAEVEEELVYEIEYPWLLTALRGSRALLVESALRLADGRAKLTTAQLDKLHYNIHPLGASTSPEYFRHNAALALSRGSLDVEVARRPLHEQADYWTKWAESYARLRDDGILGAAASFYLRNVPPHEMGYVAACRQAARLRSTRLALAFEQFRIAHGRWPENKFELAGDIIAFGDYPADPYSGGPLVYAPYFERGVLVHSAGPDGVPDWQRVGPTSALRDDVGMFLFHPDQRGTTPLPDDPFAREPETIEP